MNVRDYLTLAAIIGVLALMLFITRLSQPERAKPGSPEHAAYLQHYIGQCLQNFEKYNGGRQRHQLLSEPERQTVCYEFVIQADRLNPVARPLIQH